MKKTRKTIYIIVFIISSFLALCALLSLFSNADVRYLKLLNFPRIQFFLASFICLIALAFVKIKWLWYDYFLTASLVIGIFINSYYLINYTEIVDVAVPTASHVDGSDDQFSLLLTNVKMSNRNSDPLLNLIKLKNPDLILAMEVDGWWSEKLKTLENEYPYSQKAINEVAYGMVLFSKFPLKETETDYLNNKKVPSFESTLTLPNNKSISFHGIHPVPPTHFEELPDNEGQQEDALKELGKEIIDQLPAIVAGDLNDAVWSYIDQLTGTENILFDVRVGRGFFNSYNAEHFFMKWPLDHVFVTKEFRLVKLERLKYVGSDHYPIYLEMQLKQ